MLSQCLSRIITDFKLGKYSLSTLYTGPKLNKLLLRGKKYEKKLANKHINAQLPLSVFPHVFLYFFCNIQNCPLQVSDVGWCRLSWAVPFLFYYRFSIMFSIFSSSLGVFLRMYSVYKTKHIILFKLVLPAALLQDEFFFKFMIFMTPFDLCYRLKIPLLSFTAYEFFRNCDV